MQKHKEREILRLLFQKKIITKEQAQHSLQVQRELERKGRKISAIEVLYQHGKLSVSLWQEIVNNYPSLLSSYQQAPPANKSEPVTPAPDNASEPVTPAPESAQEHFRISSILGPNPGSSLGEYEILEEIGRGGMGVVYKAHDKNLQRIMAIKIIVMANLPSEERKIGRFYREIQLSGQLNHPNIVKVYNAGRENNALYLVMEYIQGVPLHEYLKQHSLSITEKATIFKKILEAMEYAHQHGVIHRDLKPSNIMMKNTPEGAEPVLMDFGLAKSVKIQDKSITKTGEVVGTPRYMAPEQLMGKSRYVDIRTDIYALGAIFYEVIADRPLVTGSTPMEIFYHINYGKVVSLQQIFPNLPITLWHIIEKSTAKKKEHRYSNTREFILDLERFLEGKKVNRSYHVYWQPLLIASVLLCFLLALGGSMLYYYQHFIAQEPNSTSLSSSPAEKQLQQAREYFQAGKWSKGKASLQAALSLVKEQEQALKIQILEALILNLAERQEYQQAISWYQKLPGEHQKQENLLLAIGKAFYSLNQTSPAQKILQQIPPTASSGVRAEAFFYQAMVFFRAKEYQQAATKFAACLEIIKQANLQESNFYPQLILSLGESYFHLQNYPKAVLYLQQAEKVFPSLAAIYELQGKCFWFLAKQQEDRKNSYLKQALTAFEQCSQLAPKNHQYLSWLGTVAFERKDYPLADQAFTQALEIYPGDYRALQGYLRLGLEYITHHGNRLQLLLYYLKEAGEFSPSHPYQQQFQEILNRYREDFLHHQRSQQIQTVEVSKFLDQLITQNTGEISEQLSEQIEQAILSFRYLPEIEEKIQQYQQQLTPNGKSWQKVTAILTRLQESKQREKKKLNYYLLARNYVEKQTLSSSRRKQQLPLELCKRFVQDSQEKPLFRYLAAHEILQQRHFEEIYDLISSSSDPIQGLVCSATLQEINFSQHCSYAQFSLESLPHHSEFVRFLLAKQLPFSQTTLLQALLEDPQPKVRVAAALRCFDPVNPDVSLIHQGRKVLVQEMKGAPSPEWFDFLHYHFWHNLGVFLKDRAETQQDFHFRPYLKLALTNTQARIQQAILANFEYFDLSPFIDTLSSLAQNPSVIENQFLAIIAISYWLPENSLVPNLIQDEKQPFLTRLAALTAFIFAPVSNFKFFRSPKFLSNFIKQVKFLKTLAQSQNPNLRASIFYLATILGNETFDHVEGEENPLVLANLLLNVRLQPLKFPFLPRVFQSRISREKKLQITKRLGQHPSPRVRLGAYAAWVTLAPQEEKMRLYQQVIKQNDHIARQGAALGFYGLIRFWILGQVSIREAFQIRSIENAEKFYLEKFNSFCENPEMRKHFYRHLNLAIELHPIAEYYFQRALVAKAENRLTFAKDDIQRAIAGAPHHYRYLLEEVRILILLGKNHQAAQKLKHLSEKVNTRESLFELADIWLTLAEKKVTIALPQALEVAKKAYLVDVTGFPSSLALARVYAQMANHKMAKKILQYIQHYHHLAKHVLAYPEFNFLLKDPWYQQLPD